MVLDAVARGMKKIDSISKVTKLSKDEIELIVNDLLAQKILIKNEKKGFFGNKKIELDIADIGVKILNTKKQELSEKSDRLHSYMKLEISLKDRVLWILTECGFQ